MLIFDRGQKQWAILTAILFAVATIAYLYFRRSLPGGLTGSTRPGLWFGVLGALAMLF